MHVLIVALLAFLHIYVCLYVCNQSINQSIQYYIHLKSYSPGMHVRSVTSMYYFYDNHSLTYTGSQAQPPTFTSPSYSVQVPETTAITVVGVAPSPRPPDGFLTVRCINHFNSSVGMTYTIGQVYGCFPFVLNSITGNISVTQDLVYAT